MARHLAFALALVGVAVQFTAASGCTSTSSNPGADAAAVTPDGHGGVSDGGCVVPTLGATCTAEEAPCQPSDRCCVGYEWFCNAISNSWEKGFLGCMPPPSCGDAATDTGADASGFPMACVDAGPVPNCTDADIEAKNYDQSCQTNSDCVLVGEGESCFPCSLAYGPYGAISHSDLARFEADVAKTPAGNLPVSCAPSCTPSPSACCLGGKCQAGSQCANPTPTDAAADTGAGDAAPDGGPLEASGG